MDWTAPINAYCERTDHGFWSEPVNALTNLAFIVAAGAGIWLWRRRGGRDVAAMGLIAIVVAIGIGSFLFHTLANRWSLLADVIPITIFIYVYFFLAMGRFFGLKTLAALGVTATFFLASYAFGALLPQGFLAGSGSYLPALLAIVGVGAILRARTHPVAWQVLAAGAVLAVSLTFRTLDPVICDAFPLGTHFMWHLLNGVVLFTLVHALMCAPNRAPTAQMG